ncbi:type II secretion system F family protein [Sphingomonas nostoxanthinifaciens]|uniref:type II secretion system F family protein n=1 Tax=Sphingomonas nostoxanthinifaciens TaxID=2872652 RepID=UPI001CC1F747|nr:type II secretion system F family protein [Sphingomonas nostoxanthinifaciens]UAK24108.1 type II secretion system F family protein [Sphingomonas nostoxanthinifaciens]
MIAIVLLAALLTLGGLWFVLERRPATKTRKRRLAAVRARHAPDVVETQLRRIASQRDSKLDTTFGRLLPNPDLFRRRLEMTGRPWTLGHYALACAVIAIVAWVALLARGAPLLLTLFAGLFAGIGLPYMVVGRLGQRRIASFVQRFPDAIELLVRGLRSGLPISETLAVVGVEMPGPVGIEFRAVADRMRIGRTMEAALQESADRLATPEFQFFVITLAIQRETGGNLAETLSNLADVLRKRMQMRLKIKAMSSESKASAYIIGALPFVVFGLIYYINPGYMGSFFSDQRLVIAAMSGGLWMSIGVFIMAKMINFEI